MKEVALGTICTINPRKPQGLDPEGKCSFIPMDYVDDQFGVISEMSVRRVTDVEKGYTYFQERDVLFAKITPCMENGKCAIAKNLINEIGFGSTEFHVIRAKESIIPEWIYYYLRQETTRKRAERSMTGSAGQRRVPTSFLKEILVPLPPLPEQQRIASVLSKADWLRRLRRTARELSDTYLQSVFLEMFGDPVSNPRGWEISVLEKLLKSPPQNGLYIPAEQYESDDPQKGIEMVHMSDLFYEAVQRGNLKRVKADVPGLDKYSLTYQDLLIARRSLNFEGAAKPCRIPKSEEPLVFESSMIRITPDQAQVLTIYLYYYLANERAKKARILKHVTQSTISGINQDGLKQLEIIVPPLPLQQQFAHIAHKFERLRVQQREAERQSEHLFQTLLHRAFQGEL